MFVDHLKAEMSDLRVSTPYGHLPCPVSILIGLTSVCHIEDGNTPLLGYRFVEELFPSCTEQEKEEFLSHFLKLSTSTHAFDFVIEQIEKGNVSFPHTLMSYKEVLSLVLSGWSDVSSSHRQKAIDLLSNKELRNDILKRFSDLQYKNETGNLLTRFPDIDHFCELLPQEDLSPLVECLLEGQAPPSSLPPFLKAFHEKELISQELSLKHTTTPSKKM